MTQIPIHRQLLFWFLVVATCGWDLYTKSAVFASLGPHQPSPWVGTLFGGGVEYRFHTTFNHGALWGVGQGWSKIFAGLSFAARGVILFWLFVKGHANSLWLTICLAFIMGGTLGNLYDRLALHGYRNADGELEYAVRDFLFFDLWGYHWPVFNFADVFLVTGAIMLGIYSFFVHEEQEVENATESTGAETLS